MKVITMSEVEDCVSITQCRLNREAAAAKVEELKTSLNKSQEDLKDSLRREIHVFENNLKEKLSEVEKDISNKLENRDIQINNQIDGVKRHHNLHVQQTNDRFKETNIRIDKYDNEFQGENGLIAKLVLFFAEVKSNTKIISKHDKMLFGTDKDNPGMDTRMTLVENNLSSLVGLQKWILTLLVPTIVSIIIFILSQFLK